MNKTLALASLTACLLVSPISNASPVLNLTPETTTINVGSAISLDLTISGLDANTALGAYDISINFDPSLLAYQQTTFGDPILGDQFNLSGFGQNALATPSPDNVNLIEFSLDDPTTLATQQARSFILVTLTFDTLAAGNENLSLVVNSLSDVDGNTIFSFAAQDAAINIISSTSPVPLPGGLIFFMSGVVFFRLKNKRSLKN